MVCEFEVQIAISFILPFESVKGEGLTSIVQSQFSCWVPGRATICVTHGFDKHQALLKTCCKQLALGPHVCMRGRGNSVKQT